MSLHPVAQAIFETKGVADPEAFLNPSYDARPDPLLMKDMDRAVERILRAIGNKETIAAWTDYDCDGVPAGALLSDFFRMIGYPLRSYIPERSEGYGLSRCGIETLKEEGVSLIVTADCGITDIDEVAYAKSLGIDVIITDHHLPLTGGVVSQKSSDLPSGSGQTFAPQLLPPAIAVLNPHRTDNTYPFTELCGTGVAFKLVEGLIMRGNFGLIPGQEKWLLDLVALATIADMVPLTGENRALVRWGLEVMRKGRRKGVKALLDLVRVPARTLTEDDIAFSIAPKINAASRMKSPSLGLELLTTDDDARARELAATLINLNGARKLEGARVGKEVKRRLDGAPLSSVIVMGHSTWNPSLLGIAATSVVENYRRTVCLWGKDPSTRSGQAGLIKGSCRSDGSVNIVALMAGAGHLFENYGGHELSGGFSLKADAIHALPAALEEAYASLKRDVDSFGGSCEPNGTLSIAEATDALYDSLRLLSPFGVGNEKPVFRFACVTTERVVRFGSGKEHLRLTVSDDSGAAMDAVSFFASRAPFHSALELVSPGDAVTLDASLERSHFGAKKELRLRIEDLHPA